MKPPFAPQTPAEALPSAIWMPALQGQLPNCYQGSPIEMVQEMGLEMKPGLSVNETIDRLIPILADYRKVCIRLPDGPDGWRASLFVRALLGTGIARPMASA